MNQIDVEYYARSERVKALIVTPDTLKKRNGLLVIEGARVRNETVAFAPNPFLVPRIERILGDTCLTPEAHVWLEEKRTDYQQTRHLQLQKDATLPNVPNATRLWPYQRTGAAFLAAKKRAICGDDCGLGKTVESLIAAQAVGVESILVVTLSTVKKQWQEEMRAWLGVEAVVIEGTPDERKKRIMGHAPYMIIHYDILRGAIATKTKPARYTELLKRTYDVVIFDESQRLQNPDAQQSVAARHLVRQAKHVFQLTGTPMWNMPDSIWHLLHLLDKDTFPSKWAFIERYCRVRETVYGKEVIGLNEKNLPELQRLLSQYLIRREKEDVRPDLPPKIETTLTYALSPVQKKLYDSIYHDFLLPTTQPKVYANRAATLTDLRFLCDAPSLLGFDIPSPKDVVLLELLERLLQNPTRKVVVFCWHNAYVTYLKHLFEQQHYRVLATTKEDTAEARAELARTQFRDGTAQILIGTIGGVGTALNLGFADTAIFAEMSYTPPENRQAEDRLHRATTKHTVSIYHIVAEEGIEQHVMAIHYEKSALSDEMLAIKEVLRRMEQAGR